MKMFLLHIPQLEDGFVASPHHDDHWPLCPRVLSTNSDRLKLGLLEAIVSRKRFSSQLTLKCGVAAGQHDLILPHLPGCPATIGKLTPSYNSYSPHTTSLLQHQYIVEIDRVSFKYFTPMIQE